jgi:glycerophosphoryl diester phosphodiesterase/dTDP-glucose pyrophosphorylase
MVPMITVVPLAGKDEGFEKLGLLKPLLEICGKPLIRHCTEKFEGKIISGGSKLIFIILDEHDRKFSLKSRLLALYGPDTVVKVLAGMTEGAAQTVLQVKELINSDEDLLIYLADIYFDADVASGISECKKKGCGGLIPCFPSLNPKYSYIVENPDGTVAKVAEKQVISQSASAGFYYFAKGKYFVEAAEETIRRNLRTNGLFYVCPVYNMMIEHGVRVMKQDANFKFGLGYAGEIGAFRRSKEKVPNYKHKVYAHRGLPSPISPTNSLSALENAVAEGYSIELDVRETTDGKIALFHDSNTKNALGIEGQIEDLSSTKLKKTDYYIKGGRMAFLDEFLDMFLLRSGVEAKVAVHMKNYSKSLAESVCNELLKRTLSERTFIFDITAEQSQEIKSKFPSIRTGASIVDDSMKAGHGNYYTISELDKVSKAFDVFWLDEWKELYTPANMKKAASYGKEMVAISPELHRSDGNVKDARAEWVNLVKNSCDQVCTDYPLELHNLLVGRYENKGNPI